MAADVGEAPGRVGVAVATTAGVEVVTVRPGSALLLLWGGEITRYMATAVPTSSAAMDPRKATADGVADAGARHRRHTSSPCSGQ